MFKRTKKHFVLSNVVFGPQYCQLIFKWFLNISNTCGWIGVIFSSGVHGLCPLRLEAEDLQPQIPSAAPERRCPASHLPEMKTTSVLMVLLTALDPLMDPVEPPLEPAAMIRSRVLLSSMSVKQLTTYPGWALSARSLVHKSLITSAPPQSVPAPPASSQSPCSAGVWVQEACAHPPRTTSRSPTGKRQRSLRLPESWVCTHLSETDSEFCRVGPRVQESANKNSVPPQVSKSTSTSPYTHVFVNPRVHESTNPL